MGRAATATEESVSRERKTDIAVVVGSGRMVERSDRLSRAVTVTLCRFANLLLSSARKHLEGQRRVRQPS